MRYICLIALASVMAMPTVSTQADEPTADQRLRADRKQGDQGLRADRKQGDQGLRADRGQDERDPGNDRRRNGRPTKKRCQPKPSGVFAEFGLAQFRLLSGRLELDPMRYRKGSQEHRCPDFNESITVSSSSGIPSVYYRYEDDYQQLQVVAEHGKTLRIDSTIRATGEHARLEQHADGEIEWMTRRNTATPSTLDTQCQGQTLLHIVGQDEAGFEIHVNALITRMLRGRNLIDLTHRTETYLVRNTDRLSTVHSSQIEDMIDSLRSPVSAQRRAATKKLARLGTSAIPHLRHALKRHDLETEQVLRIRSLIARCPRVDDDTASSLACLLSTDRDHWQLIAKRMSQTQWVAANDHIRRCGLESLTR